MRKMKGILGIVFCSLFTMILFPACAPNFKNMKDVDAFLEKQKTNAQPAGVAVMQPHRRVKETGLGLGLTAANLLVGNYTSAVALAPLSVLGGPGIIGPMEITAYVVFNRYVPVRRNIPGQPEWDLVAETKKRIEKAPEFSGCVFERVGIPETNVFTYEYQGNEGYIKMKKTITILLQFYGKSDADVRCDKAACEAYRQYLRGVGNVVKSIIEEEDKKASPYQAGQKT